MAQSYQVFARKYRPRTFDDVLGQDHVVQTLRNAIEQERLAHAYLFVGPRGTGKTSTARILSKALNCPGGPKADFDPDDPICVEIAEGRNLDVLEIDGASNNGVDQVRDLRDTVKFAPASGKFKIYYIDEVHMLSTAAFNALLKTLEEPPPHVKFIFATTEPNKILPTIISRCQRFDLRRIPDNVIEKHLLFIAEEEGIKLDPLAAHAIAKGAEGGMRDAQSMLDQLVAFCGDSISEADVLQIFGFTSFETIAALAGNLLNHNTPGALEVVYQQSEGGKDLIRLMGDLIGHFRNLLIAQADGTAIARELPPEVVETVKQQAAAVSTDRLLKLIDHFAEADSRMKWAPNKQLHFEIGVIKAVQTLQETTLSDVIRILAGATEGISLDLAGGTVSAPVPALAAAPVPTAGIATMASAASIEPAKTQKPAPAPEAKPAEAEPNPVVPAKPEPPVVAEIPPVAPPPSSAERVPEPAPPEKAVTTPAETGTDDSLAASKGIFSDLRDSMKKIAAEPAPKVERKSKASKTSKAETDIPTIEPVSNAGDGAALWQRTIEVLAEQKPLQVAWAKEGAFLALKGDSLVVGFSEENAGHQEQLERSTVRRSIETILSAAAGRPMSIQYEVHATIDAPKPVLPEILTELDQDKSSDTSAAESAVPTEIDESFYDDPAIKAALKIFNAKIKGRG
ncbi:MAG: DNA polymerase III subunit gamma/tau [Verrucomicrobiae bacterium]|nr:DNA polymerase III subunit gamma/tau [Verrucomicrobiae bacterium]